MSSRPPFRPSSLSKALCGAALLGLLASQSALAQPYAIPAGALEDSLNRFAQTAGITLTFDAGWVSGKRTRALNGDYGTAEGLAALLAGSGLTATQGANGHWSVVPAQRGDAVELGSTNINSTGLGASTEGTGSYTTGSVSIGKLPTSIKDTPQSVSVITRQRMEDQRLTTMNDVLTQTTGVSAYQGGTTDSRYLARGFEITNFRVDGGVPVTSATFAWKDMDMALYDHVEILRGADGLYSGNGEPGGSVNFVRKRPTAVNQLSVTQSFGTWDDYRTEVDVSGPLGFDGRLRGRSVVVYNDRNGYMDKFDADRKLFHGVLEADVTDSTLLIVGYTHDRFSSSDVTYGLPRYSNGRDLDLPRSTLLAGNHDYKNRRTDNVYARLLQDINDDWRLSLDAIYAKNQQERDYYNFSGSIDPSSHTGSTAAWARQAENYRDRSIDISLKGSFDIFAGRHEAVLGYTWQNSQLSPLFYSSRATGRVSVEDIFSFSQDRYQSQRDNSYLGGDLPMYIKQNGVYGSLRLQLSDPLHLILGGRYNDYYYNFGCTGYNAAGAQTFKSKTVYSDDGVFTPFVALTYRLSDEWTAYSSATDIYLSQASNLKGPAPGSSPLDPIRGRAYEIGIKGELFDGRLNTTTALYYTKREGEAMRDTRYPSTQSGQGATCCWLGDGEVTSKGVEFEVSGKLTERLEGTFGYTYNHKVIGGINNVTNASALTLTPKHLGKAFLTYRMPGALENLRVGAGVSAQSASYISEGSLEMSQAGYAIYNAFADYRLSDHWNVALNGNNLADKKYYSTVGLSYYGNFYGDPRNFTLTLRGSY